MPKPFISGSILVANILLASPLVAKSTPVHGEIAAASRGGAAESAAVELNPDVLLVPALDDGGDIFVRGRFTPEPGPMPPADAERRSN